MFYLKNLKIDLEKVRFGLQSNFNWLYLIGLFWFFEYMTNVFKFNKNVRTFPIPSLTEIKRRKKFHNSFWHVFYQFFTLSLEVQVVNILRAFGQKVWMLKIVSRWIWDYQIWHGKFLSAIYGGSSAGRSNKLIRSRKVNTVISVLKLWLVKLVRKTNNLFIQKLHFYKPNHHTIVRPF